MYLIADDDSLLHKFKRAIRGVGKLEGELGPPFMSLYVSDSSKQLFYVLSFLSGSLTLYVSDDPDDPTGKT